MAFQSWFIRIASSRNFSATGRSLANQDPRTACDGQEALQKIAETQPDILLLDLSMPVLDGFGTVHKIREDPLFGSLPVLAVTAYAMRGDREKILNSGFDGYLSKPIDPKALEQEFERLLGKDGFKGIEGKRSDSARQGS